MKFFVLIVLVVCGLLAVYYITTVAHVLFRIFGPGVDPDKCFIPFYGWIKGWKFMK